MSDRCGFLDARVWKDMHSKLWFAHRCTQGVEVTRLPPPWAADADGAVSPSIHCVKCGLHYFAKVGEMPAAGTPLRKLWRDAP